MYVCPDYLMHYGIPGMKWGIRKNRTSVGKKPTRQKKRQDSYSRDYLDSKPLRSKSYKQLSTSEIRGLNKRLEAESQYRRLNPKGFDKGMAIAKKAIAIGGTAAGIYALSKNPWVPVGEDLIKHVGRYLVQHES